MPVNFAEDHPATLEDKQELPHLLAFGRHKSKCKTVHEKRKLPPLTPGSKSTGGLQGSFVRQMSIESSKTLGARELEAELELAGSMVATCSDPGPNAFPLKALPLKRWRAAAKIQSYLSKWRKYKSDPVSTVDEVSKVEVVERLPLPQSWVQHWPEEPDAPMRDDLQVLTELEALLFEDHGTLAAAYKFIINCIKNTGNVESGVTRREFRIALNLKASKDTALPTPPDQMFDKLLLLLRKRDEEISKAEFLRFPELLNREKALQERLFDVANEDLLMGRKLHERLTGSIQSAEEARNLLQKAAIALQLEPSRTTNLLLQIRNAPCTVSGNASCSTGIPGGLSSAVSNIMCIGRQFGGPSPGVKLDVLLAAWALCDALAKQVIALGAPTPPSSGSSNIPKPPKSSNGSKTKASGRPKSLVCRLGRKNQCKVENSHMQGNQQCQSHANECKQAFWQALLTDEILWNVGCGAEVLNDKDFSNLLRTAWDLFDNFDAVGYLLGSVGWGRMRPKLDALAGINLQQNVVGKDNKDAQPYLQNAGVLLQQIASMCSGDPRLGRIAALFGASYLADRMCSTVNRYVSFSDEAMGSAAAQVNRSACAIAQELMVHTEELLGGRKVDCCLSSGEFKIVPAATAVANPLAEWHQNVTAAVLANATVKRVSQRSDTEEFQRLKPVEKYLLGYGNLQGL